MKLYNIKYLAGGLLVLALGSCKKENLEKFPNNSIELSQSFQTVRDAKTWNTGVYGLLRGRFYGNYTITSDVQADQLNASIDFGNRNGFPHRWEGFEATEGNTNGIWSGYYRAITNTNIMIPGFATITPSDAATSAGMIERGDLNRYKADAHFARAYYYHELVSRFAKAYNPSTAASDLGVPLLLEYDVFAMPERATVKAVYDQILIDITQARTYFAAAKTEYDKLPAATSRPNITGAQGSTHFTTDALMAFEARVKLHMQDWAGAKAAADAVIATGRYPLINTQAAYKAYWHADTKTEDIMQLAVSSTSGEQANTNAIYLGLNTATGRFRPDFVPSQWVIDEYPATDIRKSVFFEAKTVDFTTGQGTLTLVNKYPGNPALFTTVNTNYQHAPKFLRIAEMYLISAEAGARGNASADGMLKLNALRSARGLLPVVATGDALFAEVKAERFRELAFEGFRLMDLKRWNEGFTRRAPQNTNFLSTGAGYTTLSIAAGNPKFVWAIPSNDVTINPNLTQNPGW